jgi:hypothetical protein
MIGQTFTLTGHPKVVFRLVWYGTSAASIASEASPVNGNFQTLTRLSEVVFVQAAQ